MWKLCIVEQLCGSCVLLSSYVEVVYCDVMFHFTLMRFFFVQRCHSKSAYYCRFDHNIQRLEILSLLFSRIRPYFQIYFIALRN